MLEKLNKITTWQASIVFTILGVACYFDGLRNQFLGDDSSQIVTNVPVHSITNIRLFFEGSTFYVGKGLAPLSGVYYRPLMTTVFSIIYTIFGAHPFYYHLFQLLLCIGSALILFLVFKNFLKPVLALFLAIIFLVHPLNSQVVFAIPSMEDALFYFFGILGIWLLIRLNTVKSLWLVAICLLLSLLSKETALVFVAIALLYLFWFNKERFSAFVRIMILPLIVYALLKINAVGLLGANPKDAPINVLSLPKRLFTAPSILLVYITKFIFPWKLASWYYWTYPSFSVVHFLVPLLIDLTVVGLFVYLGFVIHKKATETVYFIYLFFAIWTVLGLVMTLQIIPLDMTVCETWFYFSMAGLLGMIGIIITTFFKSIHINRQLLVSLLILLIVVLGVRTAIRGTNYSSEHTIVVHNIATNGQDFETENELAIYYYDKGDYRDSEAFAIKSVDYFPYATNYNSLGLAYMSLGKYSQAYTAFNEGLKLLPGYCTIYNNLAILTGYYGSPTIDDQILISATSQCPQYPTPWAYLAVLDYEYGNPQGAKVAITHAYRLDRSNSLIVSIYDSITNNQPINLSSGK
jgi:Tfp pilus assembly protein PilF